MKKGKNSREILGLSQDEMATYLGINRSQLSMMEGRKRSVPTTALQKKFWLETEIEKPRKQPTAKVLLLMQEWAKKERDVLKILKAKILNQLSRAQRQLEQMQDAYAECLLLLQVVAGLRENQDAMQSDNKLGLWLEVAERNALEKLKKNSLVQQEILKAKLKSLKVQHDELVKAML